MSSVQQLIEAAYARSTANDAGKLAGDTELIGHLNRKYQTLFAIMSVNAGDATLAKSTLSFSGSPASAAVPSGAIDILRIEQTNGTPAYIIPLDQKDRGWHLTPAVFRQGNTIYSRGLTGDPAASDSYYLYYRDQPATLSALADTLDARFPVRFEMILILDLAIYLSVKDEGRSPDEFKALKAEYADSMAMFNVLVKSNASGTEPAPVG